MPPAAPAAVVPNQMRDVLLALLLSGLMGLIGQGIRAAVGLKKAAALSAETPTQQSQFNAAYFGVSLMIGFIAGILAGIAAGLDKVAGVTVGNYQLLLGIVAAGYAGADFIESAFTRLVPGLTPTGGAAPAPSPSPVPVSTTPVGSAQIVGLAAALSVTSPRVNTSIWAPALSTAFTKYAMTSHRAMAAAVGQFLVETGAAFQETVENLNYTTADRIYEVFPSSFSSVAEAEGYVRKPETLANRVYANKLGNGDEASGDGYRFRGRGLIQLTGRTEYAQFAASIGKTVDEVSAYCETPEGAAMSGCWYFSSHGCVPLAESWQLSEITRRVNGSAMLGNAQRIAYSNAMLKALGG